MQTQPADDSIAKAKAEKTDWDRLVKIAYMTVQLNGGSRKYQRLAAKQVRAAAAGDCRVMMNVMTNGLPCHRDRAGRPRNGRLY